MPTCAACSLDVPKSAFSNAQWKKGEGARRCAACISSGKHMEDHAAPHSTPTVDADGAFDETEREYNELIATLKALDIKPPAGGHETPIVGRLARIQDLTSKPELNGCIGMVHGLNPEQGRYELQLLTGTTVLVRGSNLEPEEAHPRQPRSLKDRALDFRPERNEAPQEDVEPHDLSLRLSTRCAACGKLPPRGSHWKHCSRCNGPSYCGKQCQSDAWQSGHKASCKAWSGMPTHERISQAGPGALAALLAEFGRADAGLASRLVECVRSCVPDGSSTSQQAARAFAAAHGVDALALSLSAHLDALCSAKSGSGTEEIRELLAYDSVLRHGVICITHLAGNFRVMGGLASEMQSMVQVVTRVLSDNPCHNDLQRSCLSALVNLLGAAGVVPLKTQALGTVVQCMLAASKADVRGLYAGARVLEATVNASGIQGLRQVADIRKALKHGRSVISSPTDGEAADTRQLCNDLLRELDVRTASSPPDVSDALLQTLHKENEAAKASMQKKWPLGKGDPICPGSRPLLDGYVTRDGRLFYVGGIPRELANKWGVGPGELGYAGEPGTAETEEESMAALDRIMESMGVQRLPNGEWP